MDAAASYKSAQNGENTRGGTTGGILELRTQDSQVQHFLLMVQWVISAAKIRPGFV